MTKRPLNISGFTPAPDVIAQDKDLGPITAMVYGRVWRYCRASSHLCYASMDKIATSMGFERTTVYRHLKKLEEAGYILDNTPDLANHPHHYTVTDKLDIQINISMGDDGVAESIGSVAEETTAVAESNSKKEEKKESKKRDSSSSKTKEDPIPEVVARPMVDAICEVTHRDYNAERPRIRAAANTLIRAGHTASDVRELFGRGGAWYKHDWRGQKGNVPNPSLVTTEISVLKAVSKPTQPDPDRKVYD